MKVRHTLADGMFGAKTQEELRAKAEEFLRSKGVEGRVELEGSDGISFETGVDPEDFELVSEKARSLCRAHQFGKAKQVFEAALALHPLHSETYRLYAQVLMEQGRIDEAVASCIEALRLDPKKRGGYAVAGLPGKDMSGYEALAYYYVSFAIAIPEMVDKLGLPFADAYETAKKIHEARHGRNNCGSNS